MTAADAGTAVVVFARLPVPGAVKTRLIPLLGPEGAAALHARLVKRTLATARASALRPIWLYGAPGVDDAFFRFCATQFGAELAAQSGGDLGARMIAAFESALAAHPRVLLLGTDCPVLTARHLRQADRALRDGADAILVPCEDGGYALMGLKRVDARLFDGIAWGGENVLADTRARLTALGWRWRELDTLWDVDRPEDYERLVASGVLNDRRAAEPSFRRRRVSS